MSEKKREGDKRNERRDRCVEERRNRSTRKKETNRTGVEGVKGKRR